MRISIVISTFNAEKTLEKALRSIFDQTYSDVEILIADGASTDGTVEIIRSHANRIAHWISEKDRGIYDAWNKVVPKATGEWVFFLGADDELYDSTTLERLVPHLSEAQENVVYGRVALILPNGETRSVEGRPWEKLSSQFRHVMNLPHQGVFHRQTLFATHGLFDPTYRICGDYEFLLRELKNHSAKFVPEVIVTKMSLGGVSSEFKNIPVIIDELGRAQKANGFGISPFMVLRRFRHSVRMILISLFGAQFSESASRAFRKVIPKL